MALDGVPWAIGGDAEHGPNVARQLAYLATSGNEGIVGPNDLKVSALAVPGAGVQVAAGAASVLNRVSSQEAYTVRNPVADATSVKIAATGSSAGRSDLVVCVVDNPYVDGNAQAPADAANGPYNRFAVIAGVPAGTTRLQDVPQYAGMSAITLARIDLPASTGTVTSSMVKDLRVLANPHETTLVSANLGTVSSTLSATTGTLFPAYQPSVQVPNWATHVRVDVTVSQLSAAGNSTGYFNLSVRDNAGATTIIDGDQMTYNVDSSATSTRFVHLATCYGDIRAYQGQTVKPSLYGRKSAAGQANLTYDSGSQMVFRTTFYERIS
jgi:hypothetical protein